MKLLCWLGLHRWREFGYSWLVIYASRNRSARSRLGRESHECCERCEKYRTVVTFRSRTAERKWKKVVQGASR